MCGRNWPHKQAASCSYQEYIHRPKSMSVREQLQSMAYQEVRYFADGLAWLACVFMQKLLDYSSQAIGRRQAAMKLNEAIEVCEGWFAYLQRQKDKAAKIQKLRCLRERNQMKRNGNCDS